MTAWQALLAASQLSVGTAWQLLTNPKTGVPGIVVGPIIESDVMLNTYSAYLASDVLYSSVISQVIESTVHNEDRVADQINYILEAEVIV